MTTEEKFHAAVNVIRNLPKSGSYQPSHDLMLRFYSYFKQATEGPCKQPKPGFWDVVRKAKWDAWKKLADMSKEDAMKGYVEELRKIVETMSYNDNVETFMGSLDSFYENVPAQELDMILGPVIERVRSQPGSPLSKSPLGSPLEKSPYISRDASPSRNPNGNGNIPNSTAAALVASKNNAGAPSGEKSKYAVDDVTKESPDSSSLVDTTSRKYTNVNHSSSSSSGAVLKPSTLALESLTDSIHNIQTNLSSIGDRIKRLEMLSKLLAVQRAENSAWNLARNNVPVVAFLVLWPVLTQLISVWIQARRRARR
uniref:Acyl-CoA-binding domain-containing protein 5A n=2 Tax=Cacopsylla melanoneura TaxID=428564 RepID=A0A8D8SEE7_9HEMI